MRSDREIRVLLARTSAGLQAVGAGPKLLAEIAWPRAVEERFFADGARKLPEVSYAVDRDALDARIAALAAVARGIDGDDEVAAWLRRVVDALIDGNRLLLAAGTGEFYRISRELYGGARTRFRGDAARNLDLAEHLLERLTSRGWDEATDPACEALTDAEFATRLAARAASAQPEMELSVVVDDDCTAKVLAGTSRVRVRKGAVFGAWEVDNLFVHEVETHALTAQNGAAQSALPFLRAGGPRTTTTQEGLAIFAELYHRTLTPERMQRLATRVRLVDMAEQGADFLELYAYLLEQGSAPRDAYLDAQRICRGGKVTGGAPFTKDACYLAGLLRVYSFLSVVVRAGLRDEAELLVAGRVALEDLPALVSLRQRGILTRPRFRPAWLAHWQGLLPYFAFASFVRDVSLAAAEDDATRIFELARASRRA